jgi:HSP20 family protein
MTDKRGTQGNNESDKAQCGITRRVLHGLDGLIPGLGKLVEGMEESEAFQRKLEETDAEIERRMKNVQGTAGDEMTEPRSREVTADVFDEGDFLMVIAELPGVNKEDLEIEARKTELHLKANGIDRRYDDRIALPCTVSGSFTWAYKNGVLKIKLEKETNGD